MEQLINYPSSLVSGQTLAFTAELLEAVLDEWIKDFSDEAWLEEVTSRAKGDVRIVGDLIEERQSMAWRRNNIDPDSGFRDLGKAKNVFTGHPVCQKLMFVAMREEVITNQCATGKIQPNAPQTLEQMKEASVAAFPQMMAQLQQHLRENPDRARQMTSEQQQMLRQMIMVQQQLQQQQQRQQQQATQEVLGEELD